MLHIQSSFQIKIKVFFVHQGLYLMHYMYYHSQSINRILLVMAASSTNNKQKKNYQFCGDICQSKSFWLDFLFIWKRLHLELHNIATYQMNACFLYCIYILSAKYYIYYLPLERLQCPRHIFTVKIILIQSIDAGDQQACLVRAGRVVSTVLNRV